MQREEISLLSAVRKSWFQYCKSDDRLSCFSVQQSGDSVLHEHST